MTIVLQENEELVYHPITGDILTESDYRRYEDCSGRVFIDLGNCNNLITNHDI
jgi:hypothetical protein